MDHPDFLEVKFADGKFRLSTAERVDLVAHKIQEGSYESPLPMVFAATVSRNPGVVLDVGANNGVYSLIASVARPGVQIIAFEPYPPVLSLLRRNIELNNLEDQVHLFEVALSDEECMLPIYLPDQSHGMVETSASLQMDFIANAQPAMMVQTRRLDDISLDGPVSVIKVDIEGYELEFLRGALATIQSDRPFIFAEMLSAVERKFPEITAILVQLDYMMFRLRPEFAILTHGIVFDQQAWNYALVPKEKLPSFREVCLHHGLEILAPV